MGRKAAVDVTPNVEINGDEMNGSASDGQVTLTSAQRLAVSASSEVSPDAFGREAKHFTEIRVLNREVGHPLSLSLCVPLTLCINMMLIF